MYPGRRFALPWAISFCPFGAGTSQPHRVGTLPGFSPQNGTIVANPKCWRGAAVASSRCVGSSSSNPSPCWLQLCTGDLVGSVCDVLIISRMTATSLDVNWLGLDFGHDGISVNPDGDLLTQAWYRLGESRIMASTLRSGKSVQARFTSWSSRCLFLPSGSLDSSRENPGSLRSTISRRRMHRSLRTCKVNRATSDSSFSIEWSELTRPMTGLGDRDFHV